MAGIYTYKQFEDAARAAGLYDRFSEADLLLAKKNPDAGMSILKYKQDYASAETDDARALANEGAERIRSSYGGYTGGGDGGSFHLDPLSPSSFTYDSAPVYTDKYEEEANKMMQAILGREKFSYSPESDPLYGSYKKQYTREGQRATADAIGTAAAATGGIPSSYAVTAGTQAGDYYASKMADKVPELHDLAYQKYMNDYQMKMNDLDVVRGAQDRAYNKYLDQLSQHNEDRKFAYGQYLDEIDSQTAERAAALEKALYAAEYGDYSFLEKMGVTPNLPAEIQEPTEDSGGKMDIATALKIAEAGDSRPLAALGVDTGYDARQKEITDAMGALWDENETGVLDDAVWERNAARYGEETLRNAGFRKKSETEPVVPDGTEPVVPDEGEKPTMDEVNGYIETMLSSGKSREEIGEAIGALYANGLMSLEDIKKAIGELYTNRLMSLPDVLWLINNISKR